MLHMTLTQTLTSVVKLKPWPKTATAENGYHSRRTVHTGDYIRRFRRR